MEMCETTSPLQASPLSVRELEVLHAVLAMRKTTAAAQHLGISQPAVSRAIANLEARLGVELFQRDGGRLIPTASALALDAQAAPLLAGLTRLASWPHGAPVDSLLRVIAPPTLAQGFLTDLISDFMVCEPETRIQLEIARGGEVVSAVADGSADVGLVDAPTSHPGVTTQAFRRSLAHVMMWPRHDLASKAEIGPRDLDNVPIIALTRRFPVRAQMDLFFSDAGVKPRIALETTTSIFVAALVRRRMGVSVVNPFPLSILGGGDLVYRPFTPSIVFETSLIFPASGAPSPVARRFADFLRAKQPDDAFSTALR